MPRIGQRRCRHGHFGMVVDDIVSCKCGNGYIRPMVQLRIDGGGSAMRWYPTDTIVRFTKDGLKVTRFTRMGA